MRFEKIFIAIFLFSFLSFTTSVTAGIIQFEDVIVNETSPMVYKYPLGLMFNVTVSNADYVDNIYLEENFTGTMRNSSNITTHVGGNFYTTIDYLKAGAIYHYSWVGIDATGQNRTAAGVYNFTINKANTSVTLLFNGSSGGDAWWQNNTGVNMTVRINVTSYLAQQLKFNLTANLTDWNAEMNVSKWTENRSQIKVGQVTNINVTAWFAGNENYTTSSNTRFIKLTHPFYSAYSLNDTYIHFNQSVSFQATLNHSFTVSAAYLEINTSASYFNITFPASSVNYVYVYNLTQTNLHNSTSNATTIYINKVYVLDSTNNASSNSTGLSFTYGTTTLRVTLDPTSVGVTETEFKFNILYNASETNGLVIKFNCSSEIFGEQKNSTWISPYMRTTYNPYGREATDWVWIVNCSNSSYQPQTAQGVYTLTGGGPGPGNGGGPAPSPTTTTTTTQVTVPVIYCGNGICEVDENWLNCWSDCPLISLPGPTPSPGVTTTTTPAGGPVVVSPEQQETIILVVALVIIGAIVTKILRFW